MKKLYTLVALSFAFSGLHAQWTMTAADFPQIGDSAYFTLCDTTGVTAGVNGTGAAWDYTSLVDKPSGRWIWIKTPAAVTGGASCPTATVSQADAGANYFHWEEVGADSVELVGEKSVSGTTIAYSSGDAPNVREYPFDYGDAFTDSCNAVYPDGFISNVTRKGIIHTSYDGAGTLVTPAATYSDVIKIHTQWTTHDSSWTGLLTGDNYNDLYEWYQMGERLPVLIVWTRILDPETSGPTVTKEVMYRDVPTVNVNNGAVAVYEMFPNPASESSTARFSLNHAAPVRYELVNLAGQVIRTVDAGEMRSGLHDLHVNLSGMDAGFYFLRLYAGDVFATHKLILE